MKHFYALLLVLLVAVGSETSAQPFLGTEIVACPDQMVILDAGPGFVSYLWNTGANTQSITVYTAGLYWVEVTNSTGTTMRDSVNVSYYPPMLPLSVEVSNPYCFQSDGAITIIEPEPLDYMYSINGGITFQEEEYFPGLEAGVYSVIAEDTNGCVEIISTVVLLSTGPVITNIETTPAHNGQADGSINILASGLGPLNYLINDSVTQSTGYFTGLSAGVYHCTVFDTYGCAVSSNVTVPLYTATNSEFAGNDYFTVSPNPFNGTGRIIFSNTAPQPESITISNMHGQVIKQVSITQSKEVPLDLTGERAGMYVCKVVFKSGIGSVLIVKF